MAVGSVLARLLHICTSSTEAQVGQQEEREVKPIQVPSLHQLLNAATVVMCFLICSKHETPSLISNDLGRRDGCPGRSLFLFIKLLHIPKLCLGICLEPLSNPGIMAHAASRSSVGRACKLRLVARALPRCARLLCRRAGASSAAPCGPGLPHENAAMAALGRGHDLLSSCVRAGPGKGGHTFLHFFIMPLTCGPGLALIKTDKRGLYQTL